MKYYDYLEDTKELDEQRRIEIFTPIIQRKWDSAKIEDFKFITSGRINSVYRITLRDAPVKSAIIKVRYMNDSRYKQGFACEEWVNNLLDDKGLNITPRIYMYDDTRQEVDFDYAIYEEIEIERDKSKYDANYYYKAGQILAQIHSISLDYFGKSRENYHQESAYDYYDSFFDEVLSRLKLKNEFLYDMARGIISKYYKADCYAGLSPVLLHHDYHMQNIVIDKNGELKIIDWDSARGGIPEADLIKIKYWNFKGTCMNNGVSFINGYNSINGTPITTNFPIHELVWLLKMYLFESDWGENRDASYFPNANYYENIIRDKFCNYKYIDEYMRQVTKEPNKVVELFFRESVREKNKQKERIK